MQGITEWLIFILARFTNYRMMREAILHLDYPEDSTADSDRRAKLYARVGKTGFCKNIRPARCRPKRLIKGMPT
jgi:hypothetical protein